MTPIASTPGGRPAAAREDARRVAIVDSDRGFLTVLHRRLEAAGWRHHTLDAPPGAAELADLRVGAVVVDVALLGADAERYLRGVAAELPGAGIVVCTARSSVAERVRGLRAGADDWLTKPCHPEELVARVEAVVRRRRLVPGDEPIGAGELSIVPREYQAYANRQSLELTRREYELIDALARADGGVLEREEIYSRVWGYTMARGDRSVDVFVRKLRGKLARLSPGWRYIHTHHGVGYRFAAEPERRWAEPSAPIAESRAEAPSSRVGPRADPLTVATLEALRHRGGARSR